MTKSWDMFLNIKKPKRPSKSLTEKQLEFNALVTNVNAVNY